MLSTNFFFNQHNFVNFIKFKTLNIYIKKKKKKFKFKFKFLKKKKIFK